MTTTNLRFVVKNGLDNNSNSITNLGVAGASLTQAGAFALTLTTTGTTNVTLPTSGTLATTAGTVALATSLAGGTGAGYLPYQSALNTTSFVAPPATSGYLLSNAGGPNYTPVWVLPSTFTSGASQTTTISDNTLSSATWYPTFVSATSGNRATTVDSVKLSYVPSTGTFSATTFVGALTGNVTGTVTGHATLDLPLTGGTLTGALTLAADPTASLHAATKNYVDTVAQGMTWKAPVRVATTGAGTLASSFAQGQVVDGITLVVGDRILVKNQTAQAENGIYTVNPSGAPTRATDMDATTPLNEFNGAAVFVEYGTTNAGSGWTQTSNVSALGTSGITFVQFATASGYSAGTGLSLSGNQFSLATPTVTIGSTVISTIGGTASSLAGLTSVGATTFNGTTFSGGNFSGTQYVSGGTSPSPAFFHNSTVNGSAGAAYGILSRGTLAAAANGDGLFAIDTNLGVVSTGTFTGLNFYGIRSSGSSWTKTGTGTITNAYGLYADAPTIGTNNYAGYFSGNVSVTSALTTGQLNVTGASPVLVLKDSDNSGTGAGQSGYVSFQDSTNVERAYVGYGSASVTDLTMSNSRGAINFSVSGAEAMRIDSTGNVGIGTNSPATYGSPRLVTVGGTGYATNFAIASSFLSDASVQKGVQIGYNTSNNNGILTAGYGGGSAGLEFWTYSGAWGERMRIDAAGGLAIGTSSITAGYQLDVNGVSRFRGDAHVATLTSDRLILSPQTAGSGASLIATNNANSAYSALNLVGSPIAMQIGGVEKMRIDSAGNVGIGVTPTTRLHVSTASGEIARFQSSFVNGGYITAHNGTIAPLILGYGNTLSVTATNNDGVIRAENNLVFSHGSTEMARIDSSGNVGIGTTPLTNLHVYGSGSQFARVDSSTNASFRGFSIGANRDGLDYATFALQANSGELKIAAGYSGYGGYQTFYTNGAERMRLDVNGNVGIGTTPFAWGTNYRSLDNYVYGSLFSYNGGTFGMAANAYNNGTSWIAKTTNAALLQYLDVGTNTFVWTSSSTGAAAGSAVTLTEKMRLDTNGNLGIGITPTSKLHVAGTATISGGVYASGPLSSSVADGVYPLQLSGTTKGIRVEMNSAMSFIRGVDSTLAASYQPLGIGGSTLRFDTGTATQAMGIDASQNVTCYANLTVAGTTLVGTSTIGDVNSGITLNSQGSIVVSSAGSSSLGTILFFRNSSATAVGQITTTGSATSYVTTSDARLKTNIAPAGSFGDVIDSIKVVSFDWKNSGDHQRAGMIAQELVTVAPEAVKAGDSGETISDTWGVDYSKLVPMLVKEIQELRARIAALEAK